MTNVSTYPSIKSIGFLNNTLSILLANERTFLVPLEKFPSINLLTPEQRQAFEIIDDCYLSFLALDEVYSIEELIGL